MQNAKELNPEQISEFLKASHGIVSSGQGRAETYAWTQQILIAQEYASLGKTARGAVRAYIIKVTGLSLPQAARLLRMYRETGKIEQQPYQRRQFPRKYTAGDVTLLALVDGAHERMSGPSTQCILRREYEEFAKPEYVRLAGISVCAPLQSAQQRRISKAGGGIRADAAERGVNRRAAAARPARTSGLPACGHSASRRLGWSQRGVPHQRCGRGPAVGSDRMRQQDQRAVFDTGAEGDAGAISVSEFGTPLRNGSEFINHTVARLLNKLLVEFTKSRASRSQATALVEGKNGAVIRKLIGYGHIGGEHAGQLDKFYTEQLNPYLNFHRPLWLRNRDAGCSRQAATAIQDRRLCDPIREAEVVAGCGQLLEARRQLRPSGQSRQGNERHRMRDERSQGQTAASVQDGIASSTAPATALPISIRKTKPRQRPSGAHERRSLALLASSVSGSSCVGIKCRFQYHSSIGKCCTLNPGRMIQRRCWYSILR